MNETRTELKTQLIALGMGGEMWGIGGSDAEKIITPAPKSHLRWDVASCRSLGTTQWKLMSMITH